MRKDLRALRAGAVEQLTLPPTTHALGYWCALRWSRAAIPAQHTLVSFPYSPCHAPPAGVCRTQCPGAGQAVAQQFGTGLPPGHARALTAARRGRAQLWSAPAGASAAAALRGQRRQPRRGRLGARAVSDGRLASLPTSSSVASVYARRHGRRRGRAAGCGRRGRGGARPRGGACGERDGGGQGRLGHRGLPG